MQKLAKRLDHLLRLVSEDSSGDMGTILLVLSGHGSPARARWRGKLDQPRKRSHPPSALPG
jgi:hypothetical protein